MSYIFPLIKRPSILGVLRGQRVGITPGTLTEAQKRLAEKFKRGIADALGVPPEMIRKEPVEEWVIEFTKAFVEPSQWAQLDGQIYNLGFRIARIIKAVS